MQVFRENRLLRFLLCHCLAGIAVGWGLVATLLFTNAGGLGDLVFGSDDPVVPVLMLLGGMAVTFGSAAMGTGVMSLPWREPSATPTARRDTARGAPGRGPQ